MFCGKCGTQIPDGAAFCPSCGNTAGAQAPVTNEVQQQVNAVPKKKVNLIAVGAIAAIVVAIAIILICVFAGGGAGAGSPEALVEKYLDAYIDTDVDTYLDCIHQDVLEAEADSEGYDIDELKDELKEMFNEMDEAMKESDTKLSFNILDTENLDDDEVKDISEEFEDEYGIKITDAAEVTVELISEEDGEENSFEQSFGVVKIDGDWYIHPDDIM